MINDDERKIITTFVESLAGIEIDSIISIFAISFQYILEFTNKDDHKILVAELLRRIAACGGDAAKDFLHESVMQELADEAQELDMGYSSEK